MSPDSKAYGLGRRIAGIGALFACALVVDPARVVPEAASIGAINMAVALHTLIIPALGALGLWLVLPSPTVLAICVLMLAGAHSEPGARDIFNGWVYPAATLGAGLYLLNALVLSKSSTDSAGNKPDEKKSEDRQ